MSIANVFRCLYCGADWQGSHNCPAFFTRSTHGIEANTQSQHDAIWQLLVQLQERIQRLERAYGDGKSSSQEQD
jgi:hypothetical protein